MARRWYINGESMVRVKGGAHMSGVAIGDLSELGLAVGTVDIIPRFIHYDIRIDDFGPEIPADVMWQLADVTIKMKLINYDPTVLNVCMEESMCGFPSPNNNVGILPPGGSLMGKGMSLFSSGCHYISLNIASPVEEFPYRFPTTYLTGPPVEIPLGTEASQVMCIWRAIPYAPRPSISAVNLAQAEIRSSGKILWDNTPDE